MPQKPNVDTLNPKTKPYLFSSKATHPFIYLYIHPSTHIHQTMFLFFVRYKCIIFIAHYSYFLFSYHTCGGTHSTLRSRCMTFKACTCRSARQSCTKILITFFDEREMRSDTNYNENKIKRKRRNKEEKR